MSEPRQDICTDCGRVLPATDLFHGGRTVEDGWVEVYLCIDCLYAVNAYMQRDLIKAAFGD